MHWLSKNDLLVLWFVSGSCRFADPPKVTAEVAAARLGNWLNASVGRVSPGAMFP